MLYGYLFNAPHIFAHGFLTEVGGLDLRDYILIFLYKTGILHDVKPWSLYNATSYLIWVSHHMVGISLCYPILFMFRENETVQLICIIIELGMAPAILFDNIRSMFSSERIYLHLLCDIGFWYYFFYHRI